MVAFHLTAAALQLTHVAAVATAAKAQVDSRRCHILQVPDVADGPRDATACHDRQFATKDSAQCDKL